MTHSKAHSTPPLNSWRSRLAGLLFCVVLTGCAERSTLGEIQKEGVLHIVTRTTSTTFYQDHTGPTGFEFALAQLFAEELGVNLKITTADSIPEVLAHLQPAAQKRPRAPHLAAAQLSPHQSSATNIRFGPSYDAADLHLVYHRKASKPASLETLEAPLQVMAGSSAAHALKDHSPSANWSASTALSEVDLLQEVNLGLRPHALIDANTFAMNTLYFPDVRTAIQLPNKNKLAWAFPSGGDDSLINAAQDFFERIQNDGTLAQLHERFYGHLRQLNHVGAKTFFHQLNLRLPEYYPLFSQVAGETGIDWRLLAAISYQESHWSPTATSRTGVRGMMMLTRITAKEMDVDNRLDPLQSIRGGANYYLKIKRRLPERIEEPDRTWLALAAYNVGFGHLEDARILTAKNGGNPDRWMDVKKNLPLLSKQRWYKKTRYGYARGYEPVIYVQKIRRYLQILRWLTHPPSEQLAITIPRLPENLHPHPPSG